jgi:hypothetical protein
MPTAFIISQRRFGSAAVRRKVVSSKRDSAIVDHLAFFVAPARVEDLSHAHLVDVAGGDAMKQSRRVFAFNHILDQRRDIDQRCRIADRPILAVKRVLVRACGEISRPLAPILRLAQRGRSFVEWSGFEHEFS